MSFFGRVLSPSALKAHYLALVAVHHPDRGGDEAVMKRINVEYSALKMASVVPKPKAPYPVPKWNGQCPEYDDALLRPYKPPSPPVTHTRSKFKPKLPVRAHPRYVEFRKAWDEAYEESLYEATYLTEYFSCPP